jgi:SAM-dependent methyltransferase
MPVEPKPLFRPSVLAPHLRAFELPPQLDRTVPARWAELLDGLQGDRYTEQELLPDFLSDVFYGLLGYRGPGAEGVCTLSRERHVEVDGKFADAVLGQLEPPRPASQRPGSGRQRFVAVIEGKRPADPLDRPYGGRKRSAVEQAYQYAINLPCDWILVTNLREVRLYFKGADQRTFERFEMARLARSEAALRRFVFLLGAERMVGAEGRAGTGRSHLHELLSASEQADLEVTRRYYADYSDMRRDVLARLQAANPGLLPELVLFYTQKLLDRVLFVAFCEDRGLLPPETLAGAWRHRDPYNPRSRWETFKGLFRAIDQGNPALRIPGYNGGLFAHDPGLDALTVPDEVLAHFRRLGEFDYRSPEQVEEEEDPTVHPVDVEILGHIFEQSITDLEQLESELAAGDLALSGPTRRKREGAFYTPEAVTRFIVGRALAPVLAERFAALAERHREKAQHTAVQALQDPAVYDLAALNNPQRTALALFWEDWLAELETLRVLDPACGSGAFLIEAFDQLHAAYQHARARLDELKGERILFYPDRAILKNNLYGVDLNEQAIQICRLSIWIKTAQRGKRLTDLDHNIRAGNSLVADPEHDRRAALDWRETFPEVFAQGGFDVVVGNPPYVRQELLGELKPYLERHYASFHGMADLYVYFFERGLELLRPGGRLSFVVTNKWLRAAYAEPLRRLLGERAWVEAVVDLGHARQVFPDADVFPSITVLARPGERPAPAAARVAVIPRDTVRLEDLDRQVDEEGFEVPRGRLGGEAWELEPPEVAELMEKIRRAGVPLAEYAGTKPYRGVVTGLNEAFLVDTATRDRLVAEDPRSAEVLKPYLRGQDIERWRPRWDETWMIFARRGIEIDRYPAIRRHLEGFRERLEPKPTDWQGSRWPGRKGGSYAWYEIQDTVDYWRLMEEPKLVYQDIAWSSEFALDSHGLFGNNTVYFLPTADPWIAALLNSPLSWFLSSKRDQWSRGGQDAGGWKLSGRLRKPSASPQVGGSRWRGVVSRQLRQATSRLRRVPLVGQVRACRASSRRLWLRTEVQT